jgi:endoglucanase
MLRFLVRFGLFFCLPVVLPGQPDVSENLKIDQFGYIPAGQKTAVLSSAAKGYNAPQTYAPGAVLEVRRQTDNTTAFTGVAVAWNNGAVHDQSGDRVWHFDFSSLTTPGDYYLYDVSNKVRSHGFSIGPTVYRTALKHAVRVFYYQRSGTAKPAQYAGAAWADNTPAFVGPEQDLDCRLVTDPQPSGSKNLSGGWFDAGDFNKYTNFAYSTLHNLVGAYEQNPGVFGDDYGIPESGNGVPDILDEIRWELEWLRKMQQPDGSVLMKVSVTDFSAASPPSADKSKRRYGAAAQSAARVLSSLFAHAAIVYKNAERPELVAYGDTLLNLALKSWNYLQANPAISKYDNAGFQSANPEMSEYDQNSVQTCAAAYLFAATGQTAFRDYFDSRYQQLHALSWGFWYQFESVYQDAILYYCKLPDATPAVRNAILARCTASVSGDPQNLKAFVNQTDAYRAYLKTPDYVWGSNSIKSLQGSIFYNMALYNIDATNRKQYIDAAAAFLHYLHGVNPNGLVYLSNMGVFGAENSIREIYHNWFAHGSKWDNNPPPGYLPGGPNKNFAPASGVFSPPQNQPPQKAYKDWNTSWPENSWEITEPAIYYQAAYVKLLSKFAPPLAATSVKTPVPEAPVFQISPNPANDHFLLEFTDAGPRNVELYDAKGARLWAVEVWGTQKVFDIKNLPRGVYFIKTQGRCEQLLIQ